MPFGGPEFIDVNDEPAAHVAIDYPFADRWIGQPNKAGFELRNERTATKVYYYGSFRVVERERDQ